MTGKGGRVGEGERVRGRQGSREVYIYTYVLPDISVSLITAVLGALPAIIILSRRNRTMKRCNADGELRERLLIWRVSGDLRGSGGMGGEDGRIGKTEKRGRGEGWGRREREKEKVIEREREREREG